MYLDTDIILALIKPKDWLKPHVKVDKIENPKTSTFAIVEAELVLIREYDRKDIFSITDKVEKLGIAILPFEKDVLKKSIDLLEKYPKLNVFDSVHAAFAFMKKEKILSTDLMFDAVEEITRADPRDL